MPSQAAQKLTIHLRRASSRDKDAEGEVLSLILPELRRPGRPPETKPEQNDRKKGDKK